MMFEMKKDELTLKVYETRQEMGKAAEGTSSGYRVLGHRGEEKCPATILRTLPGSVLYCDADSARLISVV